MRLRKPRKLGPKPGVSANSCVQQPARFKNDVWTCDFIHDRTADGRSLKWLTLVDEYTRECLVLHAAGSLTGADVRRIMARVIGHRGAPTRIRSDNGSEFICAVLVSWLPGVGAKLDPGSRGKPLGERIYRIVSQSLARRVSGGGGIRDGPGRSGERPSGSAGNSTRSDRTVRWITRRRKSSARPATKGGTVNARNESKILTNLYNRSRNSHFKWTKKWGAAHMSCASMSCASAMHVLCFPVLPRCMSCASAMHVLCFFPRCMSCASSAETA